MSKNKEIKLKKSEEKPQKNEDEDYENQAFSDMLDSKFPAENSHYSKIELKPHLMKSPFSLFCHWSREAEKNGVKSTRIFSLATSTLDGHVTNRMISLKAIKNDMFIFTIDSQARTGQDFRENHQACAMFYWPFKKYRSDYQKVIRIEGKVRRLCHGVSLIYYEKEPLPVKIAKKLSNSGQPIDWAVMNKRHNDILVKVKNGLKLEMPETYHGYALMPSIIEFLQNENGYMADRVLFSRGCECGWNCIRLSP